ncbi:ribose-phosphate pyrophosphokinase [Paenibacillus xylanexedens]|uniref:ribose-phosphate pyrophosphokinase n=1 Tax=Paenibacillus xylanexedens TaxID=528191 RepID=UPI000F548015|nr:ribose-phosphate pyrophosphokinase [Paenibacillus xylanexedens]RPK19984.1 Ribose-phosphate pyrophosphokinase [Paenibacillus xylanexedens]
MIYLNGTKLNFDVFPNGETKVDTKQVLSVVKDTGYNNVGFKFTDDSDLIKLLFLKSYLDTTDARNTKITLRILYMPYSRMDRIEGQSAFTLKYISNFINSLKFYEVEVVEPHSDVSLALLDNSHADYVTHFLLESVMSEISFNPDEDYLFFPDAGAQKRYHDLKGYKSAVGNKNRDFQTGRITSLEVNGNIEDLYGKKVIILDDLCSYGGTFKMSAGKLKDLGATEVYLLVAHAEEAIFAGGLFDAKYEPNEESYKETLISKVFTTNSIIEDNYGLDNRLRIYDIIN